MRPRLDNWPAGGTGFYLNTTVKQIWPSLVERSTMPESVQIDSPESLRLTYMRQTQGLYTNFETVATTQMATLAEIGRLWAIAANEL